MQDCSGKLGTAVAVGLALLVVGVCGVLTGERQDDAYLDEVRGSATGPCISWCSSKCGGLVIGSNTCAFDGGGCSGSCATKCATGAKHEYCAGIIGACTPTWVFCSSLNTYKCVSAPYPTRCQCTVSGVAGACSRGDC